MKILLKSDVCGPREQYTGPTCVAEKWLKSQIVRLKKKVKNTNDQRGRTNQTHTIYEKIIS